MFRLLPDTNINFIGVRHYAFGLSLLLVVLGIIAFVMVLTGSAELGIDFAGGVMLQGHFSQAVSIDALRSNLTSQFPEVNVTELTDFQHPNAYIIKTKNPGSEIEGRAHVVRIKELLTQHFAGNEFVIDSEHVIGPAVGESLRKDAIWAVLVSLAAILVYIWIRFDFRFGVAATVATFHDVLAVLGIMVLLGREFDLLMITALLTLAGYSLTDTVVVFDRIRENLKKFRSRGEFVFSVNHSINEVLSRTIITSMTVMIVVVTLFLFGGEVLRDFSLALIMGVIIGTYSSVLVASPIVVEWEARRPSRFK
ncbi:MAG: protein translocase subunit SecF [candidate division Zixibacteria bacterium]|nr:protein translocase subunit SecF [candidate division Zixibacteria bacterium]